MLALGEVLLCGKFLTIEFEILSGIIKFSQLILSDGTAEDDVLKVRCLRVFVDVFGEFGDSLFKGAVALRIGCRNRGSFSPRGFEAQGRRVSA